MTFPQSIRNGFRRYADFSGTASRSEFWWWILFTTLVGAALAALPVPTAALVEGAAFSVPTLTPVWHIVVLLPTLAVAVRRLRDGGSSWAHLFWILLPVAGPIVLVVLCSQPSAARAGDRQPTASAEVLR
ncbi:DUF805 domain-containing protein [uncultured Microbacterium sp.]|uniref:DUF805 domain-containing protein n=1 Tax=uncultured Microbacterium sp. TaxID=191216 RepID=A0A1Y5P2L3_9MICO|nr:DUF805 domain-containing protein [uncultured Microbacterium sp.]SBS71770.1 conserved membrane hypothetical protein [uncultured Microbacterium sp.]